MPNAETCIQEIIPLRTDPPILMGTTYDTSDFPSKQCSNPTSKLRGYQEGGYVGPDEELPPLHFTLVKLRSGQEDKAFSSS